MGFLFLLTDAALGLCLKMHVVAAAAAIKETEEAVDAAASITIAAEAAITGAAAAAITVAEVVVAAATVAAAAAITAAAAVTAAAVAVYLPGRPSDRYSSTESET